MIARRALVFVLLLSACAWSCCGAAEDLDFWSLRPLKQPGYPVLAPGGAAWARTPVDGFILAKLNEKGLQPSPEADRRTLIRRLYFDLTGLPPSPEEIEQFVNDAGPAAYERVVERLLASPHYGERWARLWLDVVHYGESHGYDKDKPRPNAWPYRDYVIRAFNQDRSYARFVIEQLAGDVVDPYNPEAIAATGFIAAGPWDFIGHVEVPETKMDGKVARNLDRDDMVANTCNSFLSLTVQCARCHDHKFDPVTQEDYYGLQAVFAAIDRTDRKFDADPEVARRRAELAAGETALLLRKQKLEQRIEDKAGPEWKTVRESIAKLEERVDQQSVAYGYHSQIKSRPDMMQWVQIDLGTSQPISRILFVGCHDDFNGIGAGFGFPRRYRIEVADDPDFARSPVLISDHTTGDVANPGITPQSIEGNGWSGRYVRFTATRLAERRDDYIFALAELAVLNEHGSNVAAGARVTALESTEAAPRWGRKNLVDGTYPGGKPGAAALAELTPLLARRDALRATALSAGLKKELSEVDAGLAEQRRRLASLPALGAVYAGTAFKGSGNFRGTGGRPRPIHVLHRGDVGRPGKAVSPATVPIIAGHSGGLKIDPEGGEGDRRLALAEWIVRADNPLAWRSIVNRVWQYHFGRGLAPTANDFGRMGERPSHPELLDWLAVEFRDGGGSIKNLHRLILLSATYRQSSAVDPDPALVDAGNQFLWRMNRRRLQAEEIRDAILALAGRLQPVMYGPSFQDFAVEKPEHSPHYKYDRYNPDDPQSHRRSIYRFIVRSQPNPFMGALDCADPSQSVAGRDETLTAVQALALLNNKFVVRMAVHFASHLQRDAAETDAAMAEAVRRALGREPSPSERDDLASYARRYGLPAACRLVFNLNEFVYLD